MNPSLAIVSVTWLMSCVESFLIIKQPHTELVTYVLDRK